MFSVKINTENKETDVLCAAHFLFRFQRYIYLSVDQQQQFALFTYASLIYVHCTQFNRKCTYFEKKKFQTTSLRM